MVDVPSLTLEAYGSGRLVLLGLLRDGPARYTDLVRASDISEGEVSRHLRRLEAAGLVDRGADGAYALTPLAIALLRFEPALELLAERADYLRTHAVDTLDPASLLGIEALGHAEFLRDPLRVGAAFREVFDAVRSRFDGICLVAEHVAAGHLSAEHGTELLAERAREHGAALRLVFPEAEADLGVRVHREVSPATAFRTVASSAVDLAMADDVAIVTFAGRDGTYDYNRGFFGDDPRFLAWCRDLFEGVWSDADPLWASKAASVERVRAGDGTGR